MRIVSYNTQGSVGVDRIRSTQRIAETLRPLSADILCFQELYQNIPPAPFENQPNLLAESLSRRAYFLRCLDFVVGGYGVGILARGDGHMKHHLLPSGKEQRGAIELQLHNIAGLGMVTVICTHWGLDQNERINQAEALGSIINAVRRPVILSGDLNEQPNGPAILRLIEKTGLIDADPSHRPTFHAANPTIKLDYILHSPDLRATSFETVPSLASDHLPVVADLVPAALSR